MQKDYPVTEEYLKYIAHEVFSGVKKSMDLVLVTLPGQGIDSLVLTLVNTRHLPFDPSPILLAELGDLAAKTVFIPISLNAISEGQELLEQINFALKNNNTINIPLAKSTNQIEMLANFTYLTCHNFRIVMIFDTVLTINEINPEILKKIYYYQNIFTNRINLIFSVNKVENENLLHPIKENFTVIKYLQPVPDVDCEHYIKRLCKRYGHNAPTTEELNAIIENSCGLGTFIKKFTLEFITGSYEPRTFSNFETQYLNRIINLLSDKEKQELLTGENLTNGNYLKLTGASNYPGLISKLKALITESATSPDIFVAKLTATENKLYEFFLENQNKIVAREFVAKILWGENFQNQYSDWTIDKHISNLRKKASKQYKIETIKGRGFICLPQQVEK